MSQNEKGSHEPYLRMATILFVDLIGSSDAASFLGAKDYRKHLEDFHGIIRQAWKDFPESSRQDNEKDCCKDEINGDQGFFLFARDFKKEDSERSNDIQNDIFDSLRLALSIKYRWQLDEKNIDQIKNNKKPFEIAIGINSGIVSFSKESINNSNSESSDNSNFNRYKPEGYAINLAKRIEGEARKGTYSRIFVGETTYGLYSNSPGENPVRFKRQKLAPLKGIAGDIRIYEIAAVTEEGEEEVILAIPDKWKTPSCEINHKLAKVKEFLDATQDTWLGNVYCNVKWNQEMDDTENYLDIIDMARKMVEFDSKFSAWKVYLGQIVLSYFKDSLKSNSENSKLSEEDIALLKDTIDILEDLTSREPYELDAKLALGCFYLELTTFNEKTCKNFSKNKTLRALSIEQFRRIIVWDKEHEDAYYYLAAALVAKEADEEIQISKQEACGCLNKLLELCKKRDADKHRIEKIFKDAKEDELFSPLQDEIEEIIRSIE